MSYKTFEINNGVLTVKDAMYKGMAACKNNNLKSISEETIANLKAEDAYKDQVDMDIFLDSDNYSDDLEYGGDLLDFECFESSFI